MLEETQEKCLSSHYAQDISVKPKFLFHVMSNNGAKYFLKLSEYLPKNLIDSTFANVFDSCPGYFNFSAFFNLIFQRNLSKIQVCLRILPISCLLYGSKLYIGNDFIFFSSLLAIFFCNYKISNILTKIYHSKFIHNKFRSPELYLYSHSDMLVASKAVENCYRGRIKNNISV